MAYKEILQQQQQSNINTLTLHKGFVSRHPIVNALIPLNTPGIGNAAT